MGALAWIADRLQLEQDEGFLGKAFPAEDSFLLGEIALFSFVILGATGIFLGAFYEPSTSEVVYQGSVAKFQGDMMPAAYVSVLHLTYDVPYGMFLRRMHHWAAHLFVASIGLHMLRVFFTGAYRNPREPNWLIGTVLAILAMLASYTGYSLPFDEFATTATGIGYNVAKSVPLVGEFLSKLVFAGEFPSSATIPRLYFIHVVIVPAVIAGLLALHMFVLIRQKHTEGKRSQEKADLAGVDPDDDSVIVGLPAVPNQAAISLMVFFLTAATLAVLAGFLPAHNVAEYGPSNPAATPALVMPDWFLMWLYGFLKLIPASLGFTVAGVHISTEFLGGVVLPGVLFLGIFAWPFIDSADEPEHISHHPMDRPLPTAVGVGAIVLVMAASLAGMNNILASILGTTTDVVTPALAVLVVAGPVVAAGITYVLARGARGDRDE